MNEIVYKSGYKLVKENVTKTVKKWKWFYMIGIKKIKIDEHYYSVIIPQKVQLTSLTLGFWEKPCKRLHTLRLQSSTKIHTILKQKKITISSFSIKYLNYSPLTFSLNNFSQRWGWIFSFCKSQEYLTNTMIDLELTIFESFKELGFTTPLVMNHWFLPLSKISYFSHF